MCAYLCACGHVYFGILFAGEAKKIFVKSSQEVGRRKGIYMQLALFAFLFFPHFVTIFALHILGYLSCTPLVQHHFYLAFFTINGSTRSTISCPFFRKKYNPEIVKNVAGTTFSIPIKETSEKNTQKTKHANMQRSTNLLKI